VSHFEAFDILRHIFPNSSPYFMWSLCTLHIISCGYVNAYISIYEYLHANSYVYTRTHTQVPKYTRTHTQVPTYLF